MHFVSFIVQTHIPNANIDGIFTLSDQDHSQNICSIMIGGKEWLFQIHFPIGLINESLGSKWMENDKESYM